jgi:hypothetical protein
LPPLEPQAERSRKLSEAPAQEESLQAVRPDARPPAKTRPALIRPKTVLPVSKEQLEPTELQSRELPGALSLVLLPEGQRLWAGLLRPEARPLVFLQEARPVHDSPADEAQPEPRPLSSE